MSTTGENNSSYSNMELLGESRQMNTPEGFAEGSLSWTNVARTIVDGFADEWFAEYEPQPISEVLPSQATGGQESAVQTFAGHLFEGEGVKLLPRLDFSLDDLGEQVPLTQSEQGKALLEALTRNGISWAYKTTFHELGEEVREDPDSTLEGRALWASFFDMPIIQSFRVFRDSTGKETVVWSSPMLVGTRPMEHIAAVDFQGAHFEVTDAQLKQGTLPFGQWSTRMHIPAVFKSIFYLSETPFPSSVMNFPRSMAFQGLDPQSYPMPVMIRNTNVWVEGSYARLGGGHLGLGSFMPETVDVGWTFSTTKLEELQVILETVTSGLIRFESYLEDGFLNYRGREFGFPYDSALLSGVGLDSDAVPGSSARGRSQWIPGARVGLELFYTRARVDELEEMGEGPEARHSLEWAVFEGCGDVVPSLINSYVFRYLLPEKDWDTADFLLDNAIRYGMPLETENSMSNRAQIWFRQGKISEAREMFLLALDQLHDKRDPLAIEIRAEIFYYLCEIGKLQGNEKDVEFYASLCEGEGGYTPIEERAGSESPTSRVGLGGGRAKIGSDSGGKLGGSHRVKIGADSSPAPSGSGGLPKASGGKIGGALQSSPAAPSGGLGGGGVNIGDPSGGKLGRDPEAPTATFCVSCGNKFGSGLEKFCGSCGAKRS
jgi:hypothetical protein